jgi:probable phosphoglycerate mutase
MVLVRHGETAWTMSGQHTSRTDVALTERGRRQAAQLSKPLASWQFATVLASPRRRAVDTGRLAGYGDVLTTCDDLAEWDYGSYEGRTTADIRHEVPGWTLWRDGVSGGETASQVAARADRVIAAALGGAGDVLVFSHGHFLRVLAARWIGLGPDAGSLFALSPASISTLGWEREQPVLASWNDVFD